MEAGTRHIRLRRAQLTQTVLSPFIGRFVDVVLRNGQEIHGQLLSVGNQELTVEDRAQQGFAPKAHLHKLSFAEVWEVNATEAAQW
jgi:hypothetical protein